MIFGYMQNCNAEVWLLSDSLKSIYMGPVQTSRNFGLNILNVNGLYWTGKNSSLFMQLCLCTDKVRIAASNDTILFMNPATNVFNNIYVKEIYTQDQSFSSISMKKGNSLDALDIISKIAPIAYNEKSTDSHEKNILNERIGVELPGLEKSIPESVITLDDTTKAINYNAILPYLTKAMQQLQGKINKQLSRIDSLKTNFESTSSRLKIKQISGDVMNFRNDNNVLHFDIPQNAKDAFLQICDEKGEQISIIDVKDVNGFTLHANDLSTKKVYCSLIVDDKYLGTKTITF